MNSMECMVYIHNTICQPGQFINGLITVNNNHNIHSATHNIIHHNSTLSAIKLQLLGKCIYDSLYINTAQLQSSIDQYCVNHKSNVLQHTDIQLLPDNTHTFKLIDTRIITLPTDSQQSTEFTVPLPYNIPCTYNGRYIRYIYYIVVALFDTFNYKIIEYKIPVTIQYGTLYNHTIAQSPIYNRIIPLKYYNIGIWPNIQPMRHEPIVSLQPDATSITKPHINTDNNSIAYAAQPSHHSPVVYNVSQTLSDDTDVHVVQLTLDKQMHHVNDIITGYLDFSSCRIQCYRLIVTLQSIESIHELYYNNQQKRSSHTKVLQSYHQYTRNTKSCQIQFSVPHDSSPTFHTELISHTYIIQFKFIIANQLIDQDNNEWMAETDVDVLLWSLPITIAPAQHTPHQSDIKSVVITK